MIAVIDYGAGNLRSVQKALLHIGAEVRVVSRPEEINGAAGLVLPGVGAFDDCANSLRRQELLDASLQFMDTGKHFLGICVGYQVLFERSEEFNSCAAGLGRFEGDVIRFPNENALKVPQIGWNQISYTRDDCPLYRDIPDGSWVYFVHSYHPAPKDDSIVATTTEYGRSFASSVWKDNVMATQFHPEKSQRTGLKLLENFVALTRN